jgi:hypothetical protein
MGRPLRLLHQDPAVSRLFERWWSESILPRAPEDVRPLLQDLFRYEAIMRPVHEDRARAEGLEVETIDEIPYFVRRDVTFAFDMVRVTGPGADHTTPPVASPQPALDYLYQVGFSHHIDNHEIVVQFSAKTREEIRVESLLRKRGVVAEQRDRHVAGLPDASMRKNLAVVT